MHVVIKLTVAIAKSLAIVATIAPLTVAVVAIGIIAKAVIPSAPRSPIPDRP